MTRRRLDEFQRIARYFAPLAGKGALGLKDDVALIPGPVGEDYVVTADTIVENVHFFADDPPKEIAQKLLRVNLSDLAAKGAKPVGYLLSLALPPSRGEAWLGAFSRGLAEDQKRYRCALLGGDSVRIDGPTTLSVTAIGTVASGRAILRSGARVGDRLYVSGTIGDAALGLKVLKRELAALPARHRSFLVERYRLPQPRLELGRKLARIASAMMDISDGLVADLGHLCEASGVAAVVESAKLPLSDAAGGALTREPRLIEAILGGGDDYELLFTAPASAAIALRRYPVTAIGRIVAGKGVTVLDAAGKAIRFKRGGYTHF
jgi:thiamine-monophosphate kinase